MATGTQAIRQPAHPPSLVTAEDRWPPNLVTSRGGAPLVGLLIPPAAATESPTDATSFPSSGLTGTGSSRIMARAVSYAVSHTQSQALIGVTCTLLVLCLASVGGRLAARRVSRLRLEADDWICVAALIMFIGLCISQFVAHYGLGIFLQMPPSVNALSIFGKAVFAGQILYTSVTCAVKVSLLMLYRRVFSLRVRWVRIAWWANIGLVAGLFITLSTLTFTQCSPISSLWTNPGACIPNQPKISSTSYINALIDLSILILPLRLVWSLQMSHKQKIAICCVFGLGLIGVVISVARAVAVASPNIFKGGDLALSLWTTSEPAVGLICSCLPILRPLYRAGFTKCSSSREWTLRASKRSISHMVSGQSLSSNEHNSTPNRITSTLALISKKTSSNFWPRATESEMAVLYEGNNSLSTSPVHGPLPAAYTAGQEEDTDYQTWSRSLLSKPRHEKNATRLTRSPIAKDNAPLSNSRSLSGARHNAMVTGGRHTAGNPVSPRLIADTKTPVRNEGPADQIGHSHSPSWNTTTTPSPSTWQSRPQSSVYGDDS